MVHKKYASEAEREQAKADAKRKYYYKTKKTKIPLEQQQRDIAPSPLMDVTEYFSELTKFPCADFQRTMLKKISNPEPHKPLIIHCGRGSSKSLQASVSCLWIADEYASYLSEHGQGRNFQILFVSPQDTLRKYINEIIEQNPAHFDYDGMREYRRLRYTGINEPIPQKEVVIYTRDRKHHTTIRRANATSSAVRGLRADFLIIDECASVKDEVVKSADGVCTGSIANRIYMSTPHSAKSWFNDVVANKSDEYEYFNVSAEEAPWQERNNAYLKSKLTAEEYAIEVHGLLAKKEEQSYFNSAKIDKCCVDIEPDSRDTNTTLHMGIDWGHNKDSGTVMVLVEREKNGHCTVLLIKHFTEMNRDTLGRNLAELINIYNPLTVQCDNRPYEYHSIVEKYTTKKLYYIKGEEKCREDYYKDSDDVKEQLTNSHIKTNHEKMHSQLRLLIQECDLTIPLRQEYSSKLVNQLKNFKLNMSKGDDFVDGLCYAIYNKPQTKKESRSAVIISNLFTGEVWYTNGGSRIEVIQQNDRMNTGRLHPYLDLDY